MSRPKKVSPKSISKMMVYRFDQNPSSRRPLVIRNLENQIDGFAMIDKVVTDNITNIVGIFHGTNQRKQVVVFYDRKGGKMLINNKMYLASDDDSKISGTVASVLSIFMI